MTTSCSELTADRLAGQLSLVDKAALLFHPMAFVLPPMPDGTVNLGPVDHHLAQGISHFAVMGPASPEQVQQLAEAIGKAASAAGLPVPVTLSSDPRQVAHDRPGHASASMGFSEWPEPLGLAALRDPDTAYAAGRSTGEEFRAAGMHVLLGPQIDLVTELRWARGTGTFGGDPDLTIATARAYLAGLQGDGDRRTASAVIKHFPGGGPQADGEDPHFAYGTDQIYPGGHFDTHLRPFTELLAAGATQVMPYYGRPIGLGLEEVGFAFNRDVIGRLLREQLGFDGLVLADFGILTDYEVMGEKFQARAWGLEDADVDTRVLRALEAGVDQFGGEAIPEVVIRLVEGGRLDETRLDESVRRIIAEKDRLGLFEDSRPQGIDSEIRESFRLQGAAAQRRAVTVLKRAWPDGAGVPAVVASATELEALETPADLAVMFLDAPFEPREGFFERMFPAGSLEFPAAQLDDVLAVCRQVPTIVVVDLTRPAVLTQIDAHAAGLIVHYGSSRQAVLDVIAGRATAEGRLPVQLPRTMADAVAGDLDEPLRLQNPLYDVGAGITS